MTFEEFKNLCTNIQNMSLPGESSQLKMAPASRLVEQKIQSKQNNTARKAGVMVLFYGYDSLNVALIRRTIDGSVHSGQIALPGGEDRKSTRLNSSHVAISYAVFCLTKKS